MKKLKILLKTALFIYFISCKKDKDSAQNVELPYENLNGWNYHGNSSMLFTSANNSYQLYLCKVHEHSGGVMDVFYGTRYEMSNTNGIITTGSTRWTLKPDGSTIRNSNSLVDEFNSTSGRLFRGINSSLNGENIPPTSVKVLGSGNGEFRVYNPVQMIENLYFPSGSGPSGWYDYIGNESPLSLLSSLVCYIQENDTPIDASDIYWHGYNFAIAKNPTTGEYFVLSYYRDSSFFMVNAVTPQSFSTNYGTMKKTQPLFGKKVKEIIPQWDTSYKKIEEWPLYFQYSLDPTHLYFIVQNDEQIFLVKLNLNTFQFSVVHSYSQPRNSAAYQLEIFGIQFIDKEPGTFLFYERRQSGMYALLHKNGTTQKIDIPAFKSKVVPSISSIRYDNGKYWLMVADQDKKVHLFSRNY